MNIRIDWDKNKAGFNKRKHGVFFEEASTVFYDEDALEFFDPDHSENEDRFIMVGISFKTRVLVPCKLNFCWWNTVQQCTFS